MADDTKQRQREEAPGPDYEPGKIVDEHDRFALRGLLAVNSAAAIASLGFLAQVWDGAGFLRLVILLAMVTFVGGLIAGLLSSLARAEHTEANFHGESREMYEHGKRYIGFRKASLRLFCAGFAVIALGLGAVSVIEMLDLAPPDLWSG